METVREHDAWVSGLIAKHPANVVAILATLAQAGLRKGECSANDLGATPYDDPHVVGACFKTLKRIGFAKTDRIIPSTRPTSNASFILVWQLVDGWKAQAFLNKVRSLMVTVAEDGQMEMAL